jgi:hypothetical protein
MLGPERFVRLNANVPKGLFELDYADPAKLVAAARHEAMHAEPEVRRKFFSHVAPAFTPSHLLN